jgi:hypothetical protein
VNIAAPPLVSTDNDFHFDSKKQCDKCGMPAHPHLKFADRVFLATTWREALEPRPAYIRQGAKDRGEYCQAAGAFAESTDIFSQRQKTTACPPRRPPPGYLKLKGGVAT